MSLPVVTSCQWLPCSIWHVCLTVPLFSPKARFCLYLVASLPNQLLSFQGHQQKRKPVPFSNSRAIWEIRLHIFGIMMSQDNIKQKNGEYEEVGKKWFLGFSSPLKVYLLVFWDLAIDYTCSSVLTIFKENQSVATCRAWFPLALFYSLSY